MQSIAPLRKLYQNKRPQIHQNIHQHHTLPQHQHHATYVEEGEVDRGVGILGGGQQVDTIVEQVIAVVGSGQGGLQAVTQLAKVYLACIGTKLGVPPVCLGRGGNV